MLKKTALRIWFALLDFAETYKLVSLARTFLWLFIVWVVGTNCVYFSERGATRPDGRPSPYSESYLDSYWMVVITVTSAGVETEYAPVTGPARAQIIVVAVVSVVLMTILTGNVVAALFERIRRRELIRMKPRFTHVGFFKDHIIICNASSKFESVLRQIVDKADPDTKIVLVDANASSYRTEGRRLFRTTYAVQGKPDNLRVLNEADAAFAKAIVILTPDEPTLTIGERDYQALITAIVLQPLARTANAAPRILLEVNEKRTLEYVRTFNSLREMYPLYIEPVCAAQFQEKLLAQSCLTHGLSKLFQLLLTVPHRPNWRPLPLRFPLRVLFGESEKPDEIPAGGAPAEEVYTCPVGDCLDGRSYRTIANLVETHCDVTLIGYLKWESKGTLGTVPPTLKTNPRRLPTKPGDPAEADATLRADDELVVLARPNDRIHLMNFLRSPQTE